MKKSTIFGNLLIVAVFTAFVACESKPAAEEAPAEEAVEEVVEEAEEVVEEAVEAADSTMTELEAEATEAIDEAEAETAE